MLSTKEESVVRARVSNRAGAGEPIGEPAPPPGILQAMEGDLRSKLPDELVDELLAGADSEAEIVGRGGLLSQLTKRLVERAMEVELADHLGYERHQEPPGGTGNTRNGATAKTLSTEHGPVEIRTPRDRDGTFDPKIVRKRQRRFEGFDEKILALYSRGLSVRDGRGDDQTARPRDGLSAEVRDGLLLGLLEVRVGAGGVVGDVDDAVDLGDSLGDGYFDALAEGDCGHAAALASPAEA